MDSTPPDLARLRIDRDAASGGRGRNWPFVVLVVLFLAYVAWREGWVGDDPRPEVSLGRVTRSGSAPRPAGVSANGYVVARRRAALSTDIQGRLVELNVEEGDHVDEGALIARLDTRQLEASRDQAKADRERARARAALAVLEYARREKLVKTGDVNVAARDAALAERDEAVAEVASIQARVDEIEVQIDKSSVFAPFSGVITAKNAEVGEVVSSIMGGGTDARAAVATLVDFATLEVQVELAQTSLSAARVGGAVDIYLDAFPTERYPGRVRQIWPTANRQKATVELRIEFLERDPRILPEMGVRAVFQDEVLPPEEAEAGGGGPQEARVYVPRAALSGPEGDRSVFLFEDGRVRRRTVQMGGAPVGGQVPVAEGLVGNERVVLNPGLELRDGDEVRVRSERSDREPEDT